MKSFRIWIKCDRRTILCEKINMKWRKFSKHIDKVILRKPDIHMLSPHTTY